MKRTIRIAGHIAVVSLILLFFLHDFSGTMEHPIRSLIAFVVLTLMGMGMWDSVFQKAPPPQGPQLPPLSDNFGTASYAPEATSLQEGGEEVWSGVFFGKSSSPDNPTGRGAPICSGPESHSILIAKTSTGKGIKVLVPTLLRYGLGNGRGPGAGGAASMVVFDPKAENASISARTRALTSHVHIVNPWNELGDTFTKFGFGPATYNPLDILDKNDPNVVSIAQSMAAAMSPAQGQKEPIWASSAANIIAATLLWLTDQPGEEKTLSRLSEILNRDRKSFTNEFVTSMASKRIPFGGAIRRLAAPFLDMPDVTYGGVMFHISEATAFLTDPRIQAATATSSFSMADLTGAEKDRPTTVYLVVPWDKIETQRVWVRLMISAAMHVYKRKPPGARYRCMFMIDEFPSLGALPSMATDIATMRGAGIDFTLVAQSIARLKDIYGEAHIDIIGNCSYKWFCNVNDLQSAEYVSKMLGNKTVRTVGRGENRGSSFSGGPQGGSSSTSEGENTSYGEVGRPLLTPDEVLNLGSRTAILLAPGTRPYYLEPISYWELPGAFSMFPGLYSPLYFDRNAALDSGKAQCQPQPPPQAKPGTPVNTVWPRHASRMRPYSQADPPSAPAWSPLEFIVNWLKPRKKIDLGKYATPAANGEAMEPDEVAPRMHRKPIDYTKYASKEPGTPSPEQRSPTPQSPPSHYNPAPSDTKPPEPAPPKGKPYDWARYAPKQDGTGASEKSSPAPQPQPDDASFDQVLPGSTYEPPIPRKRKPVDSAKNDPAKD